METRYVKIVLYISVALFVLLLFAGAYNTFVLENYSAPDGFSETEVQSSTILEEYRNTLNNNFYRINSTLSHEYSQSSDETISRDYKKTTDGVHVRHFREGETLRNDFIAGNTTYKISENGAVSVRYGKNTFRNPANYNKLKVILENMELESSVEDSGATKFYIRSSTVSEDSAPLRGSFGFQDITSANLEAELSHNNNIKSLTFQASGTSFNGQSKTVNYEMTSQIRNEPYAKPDWVSRAVTETITLKAEQTSNRAILLEHVGGRDLRNVETIQLYADTSTGIEEYSASRSISMDEGDRRYIGVLGERVILAGSEDEINSEGGLLYGNTFHIVLIQEGGEQVKITVE